MCQVRLSKYHSAPSSISSDVKTALSYYPDLEQTPITIKFKKKIRKSTMLAQPDFKTLLGPRRGRKYIILISAVIRIGTKEFNTADIPKDVMIGWLGHELGHIVDYTRRNWANLLLFGARYVFFDKHIKSAERTADAIAVARGMEDYILKTKTFILNNADLPDHYKNRIRKYYLSPEEILLLVQERESR